MKYAIGTSVTLRRRSLLSLASFVMLSIACQSGNSSNSSASEQSNAYTTPAPASTQAGSTNVTTRPPVERIAEKDATRPSIQITEVPSKGAGKDAIETIAGTVGGVKITECKVVIFARTNTWYVQPYIGSSDTSINDDNTWRTDTHLGSQYAALLVKASYEPPTTTGKLPEVGGPVLAIVTANAKQ